MIKYYQSTTPMRCDICARPIVDEFIDGATRYGPWGNMCIECHSHHGVGLGLGLGQRYKRDESDRFAKIEG